MAMATTSAVVTTSYNEVRENDGITSDEEGWDDDVKSRPRADRQSCPDGFMDK